MKGKTLLFFGGVLIGIFIAFMLFTNTFILSHLPRSFTPLGLPLPVGYEGLDPEFEALIPDEAAAIRTADAYFETYFGADTPYKAEYKKATEVRVDFLEQDNAWNVYYIRILLKDPVGFSTADLPAITLRKKSGEVISFGLQED